MMGKGKIKGSKYAQPNYDTLNYIISIIIRAYTIIVLQFDYKTLVIGRLSCSSSGMVTATLWTATVISEKV